MAATTKYSVIMREIIVSENSPKRILEPGFCGILCSNGVFAKRMAAAGKP